MTSVSTTQIAALNNCRDALLQTDGQVVQNMREAKKMIEAIRSALADVVRAFEGVESASSLPERDDEVLAEVGPLTVRRVSIYETTLDRPNWQLDMLIAMAAIKKLGVARFELDISGSPTRAVETVEPEYGDSLYSYLLNPYGKPKPKSVSANASVKLTLYAITVV